MDNRDFDRPPPSIRPSLFFHLSPNAAVSPSPIFQVLIDGPLAGSFSYRCPADGPEPEGHWVTVPWGKGRRTGLALRRHDANTLPDGLKADSIKVLETVRTDLPAPPDGWLAFLRFVARYYHGSLADLAVGNLPKLLRTPPTGRSRKDWTCPAWRPSHRRLPNPSVRRPRSTPTSRRCSTRSVPLPAVFGYVILPRSPDFSWFQRFFGCC